MKFAYIVAWLIVAYNGKYTYEYEGDYCVLHLKYTIQPLWLQKYNIFKSTKNYIKLQHFIDNKELLILIKTSALDSVQCFEIKD